MAATSMEGYLPIEHFQETDDDSSTVRIRDMPYGKRRESLVIYPTELVFTPSLVVGQISPPYPVMITNDGYDVVVVKEIKIVGDFVFHGVPTLKSLTPGQHISLQVKFTPKREGAVTGGIYLNSGSAAGEEFIHLSGTGASGSGSIIWTVGVGVPNGRVIGNVGSVYTRSDGLQNATLYVKESGNNTNQGWVAK